MHRSAQVRTTRPRPVVQDWLDTCLCATTLCSTLSGVELLVEWLTRVLPDRTMILRDNSAKLLDGIFDTRL